MVIFKEELLKTLEDLVESEYDKFKWYLKEDNVLEGYSGISAARLERAQRQNTVDLMVQKYQDPGALKVTLTILEKIDRNDLVQRLQSSCSGLKDLKNHHSKKTELGAKIKLMIQERQMKITEIKCSAEVSSKSADRHIADSERFFRDLLQSVSRSLANVTEAINKKQRTMQKKSAKSIQQLEQEIYELTKRSNEIEQLSCTEDHLNSLTAIPTTKDLAKFTITEPSYEKSMEEAVNQLHDKFSKGKDKLIAMAKLNSIKEFAKDVTLDPDTANPFLILSEDRKQVHCGDVKRNLPHNPKRFDTAANILGRQNFSSGRFYYEVVVKGKISWDLGVVKESIVRKGSIKASPENGYWTICLREGGKLKASSVYLTVKCLPKKVGVFVDYENGLVSFYDADSADVIHSFTDCLFTENLYPFFSPSSLYGGKNSPPLIISPVNF